MRVPRRLGHGRHVEAYARWVPKAAVRAGATSYCAKLALQLAPYKTA